MAETEKQEFLSPHQCFIVYDKQTKQVAISIRNRLSEKGVKCTIWDEKVFRENEIRLSNYNRLLILNKEIAEEYLGNPYVKSEQLTEYVLYRREGRVASIFLKDEKLDYTELFKKIANPAEVIQKGIEALPVAQQEKIKSLSPEEIAEAVAIIQHKSGAPALPQKEKIDDNQKNSEVVELLKDLGKAAGGGAAVGAALALLPITSISAISALVVLAGYGWFANKKDAEKCKQLLLFDAAKKFEKELLDDFVNAK